MNKKMFYWIVFGLTLVGLGLSIHLLQIDYFVKFDPNYVPACDLNSKISCSKVADSEYSSLFGIPVASWGILGYVLVALFMVLTRKSKRVFSSLMLFYFLFSLVSIYYFTIAVTKIDAICLYCTGTYAVNWLIFIMLAIAVFAFKVDEEKFCIKDSIKSFFDIKPLLIPIYGAVALAIVIPSFMVFHGSELGDGSVTKHKNNKGESALVNTYENGRFDKESLSGVAGVLVNPEVTVIVYSDYECPFCYRFEGSIKEVLKKFSNVMVIRKEFPLDNACNPILGGKKFHEHACDAATVAKCSGLQGKFWESADYLHKNRKSLNKDEFDGLVTKLKLDKTAFEACLKDEKIKEAIQKDIKAGLKLGVRGTPGFSVNGKYYSGALPYQKLSKIILDAGGKLK